MQPASQRGGAAPRSRGRTRASRSRAPSASARSANTQPAAAADRSEAPNRAENGNAPTALPENDPACPDAAHQPAAGLPAQQAEHAAPSVPVVKHAEGTAADPSVSKLPSRGRGRGHARGRARARGSSRPAPEKKRVLKTQHSLQTAQAEAPDPSSSPSHHVQHLPNGHLDHHSSSPHHLAADESSHHSKAVHYSSDAQREVTKPSAASQSQPSSAADTTAQQSRPYSKRYRRGRGRGQGAGRGRGLFGTKPQFSSSKAATDEDSPPTSGPDEQGMPPAASVDNNVEHLDSTEKATQPTTAASPSEGGDGQATETQSQSVQATRGRPRGRGYGRWRGRGRGRGRGRNTANGQITANQPSNFIPRDQGDAHASTAVEQTDETVIENGHVRESTAPSTTSGDTDVVSSRSPSRTRRRRRGRRAIGNEQTNTEIASTVRTASAEAQTSQPEEREVKIDDSSSLPIRFSDLPVALELLRAVGEVLHFEQLTPVQQRAIPPALDGQDVMVKSRSGTGKTLAFLLPSLHKILSAPSPALLIISPTRELAFQIGREAKKLLRFSSEAKVEVVTGGQEAVQEHLSILCERMPKVLIGTPGRLQNLLKNDSFVKMLESVQSVVFDEADQMADMGFSTALRRIVQQLPAERQTLLFSRTQLDDVQDLGKLALKDTRKVVDCAGETEYVDVAQSVLVTEMKDQAAALGVLLIQCMQVTNYKIVVFFAKTAVAQVFSELFEAMGRSVLQMHARKPQQQRKRTAEDFRRGKELILFTSDTSIRDLEESSVTSVIQVGFAERSQYFDRIALAKRGSSVLLLGDFEADVFVRVVGDQSLTRIERLPLDAMAAVQGAIDGTVQTVGEDVKKAAYRAWLGYYVRRVDELGIGKEEVVRLANKWSTDVTRLETIPTLSPFTAEQMGLSDVAGVRVQQRRIGQGS